MARTPIWRSIAATLSAEIADGEYRPGDKLPTEAEMAARFGVNRHTVRHALSALVEAGTIHTRRGAGAFVTQTPTDYPIGKRVRFHQNLRAAGRTPAKEVLSVATRLANATEREALGLGDQDYVHAYEGLSLADEQPIALFRSVFPAAPFPQLPDALAASGSVTAALRAAGVTDYTRAWTRLTAKSATATQALHLRIAEGAPILRSVGLNIDTGGRPVELGRTWFAGDRVTLTLADDG
ncbi:phosphonate metabolism transcriptional regulator PhnF [Tateyamaria omphalii]|uniref:Phosphonate metabolism transcriptional regulator PhnF n=1 Tax=Tateyamaria omphalii TaxID=299262 RepID=A0A1P8MQJ4_9RHOB|nr:phosphonate metabolism transcriptional regulator PhnF [Tateyamaria omphalii]APX10311.1 phosphonate metabolism transcriptional regulator PhnF [Tateyamaria omphalii]